MNTTTAQATNTNRPSLAGAMAAIAMLAVVAFAASAAIWATFAPDVVMLEVAPASIDSDVTA